MPHATGEGSESGEQQGALTPLEFAKELEALRGDPEARREIAEAQERMYRKSHPYIGPKVNNEATW